MPRGAYSTKWIAMTPSCNLQARKKQAEAEKESKKRKKKFFIFTRKYAEKIYHIDSVTNSSNRNQSSFHWVLWHERVIIIFTTFIFLSILCDMCWFITWNPKKKWFKKNWIEPKKKFELNWKNLNWKNLNWTEKKFELNLKKIESKLNWNPNQKLKVEFTFWQYADQFVEIMLSMNKFQDFFWGRFDCCDNFKLIWKLLTHFHYTPECPFQTNWFLKRIIQIKSK